MTRVLRELRPAVSATRRAARLAAIAGALAIAASVALAQQTWETTVTANPPVKRSANPWTVVVAGPQIKGVPVSETAGAHPAQTDTNTTVKEPPGAAKLETGSIKGTATEQYCANIANPAADARFAWQKKALADMEQEIAKRIALLEEKTAEYQKWLARRDEFSKKASETVLRIYARMRPDAAAVQLAALDEETAASVITKLEPRVASLILNEMDPAQAVRLTATISGSGKVHPAAPKTAEAKQK
jgi:flagellar motility protein MotE (MotC chaperone)